MAAQNRVGQGMQSGIGVGMAFEPVVVRDFHAAQPDMIACAETMRVIAHARVTAYRRASSCSAKAKSFSRGDLQIGFLARHRFHLDARQLRDRHIIGHVARRMFAVRRQDIGKAEALRRLGAIKIVARHGGPGRRRPCACSVSATASIGTAPSAPSSSAATTASISCRRDQRPGRVMDQHKIRRVVCQRLQPQPHRILPPRAARHRRRRRPGRRAA